MKTGPAVARSVSRNFDSSIGILRFISVTSTALAILVTYIGLNSGAVERAQTNRFLIDSLGWTAIILVAPLTVWICYGVFEYVIETAPSTREIQAKHSWWAELLERWLGFPAEASVRIESHLHRSFPKAGAVAVTAIILFNLLTDLLVLHRIGSVGNVGAIEITLLSAFSMLVAYISLHRPMEVAEKFSRSSLR